MPRLRRAGQVLLALVLLGLLAVSAARADDSPALDVRALEGGVSLRAFTYVLEDASGKLTLADVRRADERGALRRTSETSFGLTTAAVWIRFDVVNPSAEARSWLLELASPLLDRVDFHALSPQAQPRHVVVGDRFPFAARPVDHANFLFECEARPGERTRFYLRAHTLGTARLPLVAWEPRDFIAHDTRKSLLLALFYGAMLAMAWYNLCVAVLVRNREYAYLAFMMGCMAGALTSLSGHMFQFVLPDHPALANRATVVFIAICYLIAQLYARHALRRIEPRPPTLAWFRYSIPLLTLVALVALFAPAWLALRAVFVALALHTPIAWAQQYAVHRLGIRQLRFAVLAYAVLGMGLAVALLAHAGVLPQHPLALWAGHIGCAAFCVLMSLALPVRLNVATERLAGVNAQLSSSVSDLKAALTRAEQASEEARRATRVKDEFMATMSHELRTPLNAIINVPQGLLEDFLDSRSATCEGCDATFVLDRDDAIDARTTCPECKRAGTLREGSVTQYIGKPAHTAGFLRKIERSGRYLLNLVNGVLDFSKMEAGHLELAPVPLDLAELLREACDELVEVARGQQLRIVLTLADDTVPALGDPVRLRQVLLNLLTNAIKFSEPGGVIEVAWKRDAANDTVSVRDQGIGIARADHERVFESFEQVHKGDTRKYGGTGLGLSISRSLIRMHGGELWVESELGVGSVFTFRIPRKRARAA